MSELPPPEAVAVFHKTYSALVLDEADLVGLVAYALYKRDKLKFCEEFNVKSGHHPSKGELDIFIQGCNLSTRVQGYRAEAEKLLEAMAEFQLEEAIGQIKADSTAELAEKLAVAKSWWRSIAEALLGSFFVAVLWGALALVVYGQKIGFGRVATDLLQLTDQGGPAVTSPAAPAR